MTDCRNHEAVRASHVASMPKISPPYRENVPLCTSCAFYLDRIGGFGVRIALQNEVVEHVVDRVWTRLPGTDVEVYQETGAILSLSYRHAVDE